MPSTRWLHRVAQRLPAILLGSLWLLCSAHAFAADTQPAFDLARLGDAVSLHANVSVLKDPHGSLTLAQVRRAEQRGDFTKAPSSLTFGFTSETVWLKWSVVNRTDRARRWLLEVSYSLLDYVTLYVVHPDGRVERRATGDMLPFSSRELADTNFAFELEQDARKQLTYYLRVQTSGSLRVPLRAWQSSSTYLDGRHRDQLVLWMFYGALSVMVMFNFGVYLLVAQREYLVYTLLLITMWALQFLLAGHAAQFVFAAHPYLGNKALPIVLSMALLLIPVFARESFGLFKEFERAARIAQRCVPVAGIALVVACVSPPGFALRAVLGSTLLIAAIAPFLLRSLRKHRNPQLQLYFVSWYVLALSVPIYIVRQENLVPPFLLGDWAIQVGITLHGVISSLALATRLNIARDELGRLNSQLSSNVTDLKLALARAEQANEEARRATQVKDEFMATMSHELRTPLNAIINVPQGLLEDFVELAGASCEKCGTRFLLDPGEQVDASTPCAECGGLGALRPSPVTKYQGEPSETARFLRKIERSGKHLLQMVNGVLDFSKMEAGRLELSRVELDLNTFLREAVDEMSDLAQRKNLRLELQLDGERAPLFADPLRLKQVLLNLLSNAIKFSPAEHSIRVGRRSEAEAELIWVADQGIGIAPEDQERIFASFEQVHKGDTRKYGGTGLGLSISRSLVRMHGGELWVESALGQGSTFWLRIPRKAAPARTSEKAAPPHRAAPAQEPASSAAHSAAKQARSHSG